MRKGKKSSDFSAALSGLCVHGSAGSLRCCISVWLSARDDAQSADMLSRGFRRTAPSGRAAGWREVKGQRSHGEQRRDKSAYRQRFGSFEALPNVIFSCHSFLFLVLTGTAETSRFSSGLCSSVLGLLFAGVFKKRRLSLSLLYQIASQSR